MASLSERANYLIPEPDLCLTEAELREVQDVRRRILSGEAGRFTRPNMAPWKLLTALSQDDSFVFHGSSNLEIEEFAPRRPNDVNPFGAQQAVYAASTGLWAMFYAVLDRTSPYGLVNACVSYYQEDGSLSRPHYFLSIGNRAPERPFSPGAVYILPRKTFVRDPMNESRGLRVVLHHWASLEPVRPLTAIPVNPEDYPLLARIRRHDEAILSQRAEADPDGFPWLDEP